jgi:hypothetical protein
MLGRDLRPRPARVAERFTTVPPPPGVRADSYPDYDLAEAACVAIAGQISRLKATTAKQCSCYLVPYTREPRMPEVVAHLSDHYYRFALPVLAHRCPAAADRTITADRTIRDVATARWQPVLRPRRRLHRPDRGFRMDAAYYAAKVRIAYAVNPDARLSREVSRHPGIGCSGREAGRVGGGVAGADLGGRGRRSGSRSHRGPWFPQLHRTRFSQFRVLPDFRAPRARVAALAVTRAGGSRCGQRRLDRGG